MSKLETDRVLRRHGDTIESCICFYVKRTDAALHADVRYVKRMVAVQSIEVANHEQSGKKQCHPKYAMRRRNHLRLLAHERPFHIIQGTDPSTSQVLGPINQAHQMQE